MTDKKPSINWSKYSEIVARGWSKWLLSSELAVDEGRFLAWYAGRRNPSSSNGRT